MKLNGNGMTKFLLPGIILALLGNGLLTWRDQAVQQEQLKQIHSSINVLKRDIRTIQLVLGVRVIGEVSSDP